VQRLALRAEGGSYTLGFNGESTEALPVDAAAEDVQRSLEALTEIGAGGIEVTGERVEKGSVFRIVFVNGLAGTDVPQITASGSLAGLGSFVKSDLLEEGCSAVATRTVENGGELRFDGAPPACPEAAKIAAGSITTPLISGPLRASVYLATEGENPFDSTYGAYLVASGEGVVIKIAGWLEVDPATGRLVVGFEGIPQLPISDLDLRFKGGSRGVVTTPSRCGSYRSQYELVPWSGGPPAHGGSEFAIDEACGPADASPGFRAGSMSGVGGAFTSFAMQVTRGAELAPLERISVALPRGLTANLAGVPRCPGSVIDALTGASTQLDAAGATCPADSEIGSVVAGLGSGAPFYVRSGKLYLAGPYAGAPLSMVVVAPAVAGPFDFGTAVVRVAVWFDAGSARARAVSDPIPTSLDGVPLELRDLRVIVDRPGFATNPTNCNGQSVDGGLQLADGSTFSVSDHFQVGECAALGFTPRLALRLSGRVARNGHPALKAVLRERPSQARIARASLILPATELLDEGQIRRACKPAEYAAGEGGGELCPSGSIYGFARAYTPLLEQPLEGLIYLRSNEGERDLPDMVASLRGGIRGDLVAHTDSAHGRIRYAFVGLPDVPLTKLVLTMYGGRRGLLVNTTNLCRAKPRVRAAFRAHNGRRYGINPRVRLNCRTSGDG
jgi:hypothetical protein